MPGPYHEIYLQKVTLRERGNNNADDTLDANFIWAAERAKIADKLKFEWESTSTLAEVRDTFTMVMKQSYQMTQLPVANGGDLNSSYTIYAVAYKTEDGMEVQKALDLAISRPTLTTVGVLTDQSKAQQRDKANFELFVRAQAASVTSDNLQLQFFVFNNITQKWDQIAGATTIQAQQTVTPDYDDPSGIVETIDPA